MTGWQLRLRAVSQRITWFLGTRFADTFPLVFVTGFPKSGTTWVSQMVADYLDLPYPRHALLPIGFEAVVHGHGVAQRRFRRAVYVVRDGRDVMVSFYFHLLRQLPAQPGSALTRAQRRMFPRPDKREDVRACLPAFIEAQMLKPTAAPVHWGRHVSACLDARYPGVAVVRYEDLLADPVAALSGVVSLLTDTPADTERVRNSVERYAFERQARRRPGDEARQEFLRKGTAGDWRAHFSPEAAKVFDRWCGEALVQAGYEPDRSWVTRCEPGKVSG